MVVTRADVPARLRVDARSLSARSGDIETALGQALERAVANVGTQLEQAGAAGRTWPARVPEFVWTGPGAAAVPIEARRRFEERVAAVVLAAAPAGDRPGASPVVTASGGTVAKPPSARPDARLARGDRSDRGDRAGVTRSRSRRGRDILERARRGRQALRRLRSGALHGHRTRGAIALPARDPGRVPGAARAALLWAIARAARPDGHARPRPAAAAPAAPAGVHEHRHRASRQRDGVGRRVPPRRAGGLQGEGHGGAARAARRAGRLERRVQHVLPARVRPRRGRGDRQGSVEAHQGRGTSSSRTCPRSSTRSTKCSTSCSRPRDARSGGCSGSRSGASWPATPTSCWTRTSSRSPTTSASSSARRSSMRSRRSWACRTRPLRRSRSGSRRSSSSSRRGSRDWPR